MTAVHTPSYAQLKVEDQLAAIALTNLDRFVGRHPQRYVWCSDHLHLLCLCQGAAEHHVRVEHGIKDFDVRPLCEPQAGEEPFLPRATALKTLGTPGSGRTRTRSLTPGGASTSSEHRSAALCEKRRRRRCEGRLTAEARAHSTSPRSGQLPQRQVRSLDLGFASRR